MLGSACLSASYPISELVFRCTSSPPSEEVACLAGAVVNVLAFSTWTLVYTLPRWDAEVIGPIYKSAEPSVPWALFGYTMFAILVGVHALSFWKSVHRLGTVPTAVSRGAQQSGVFIFAHVLFCSKDPTECLWNNSRNQTHTLWSQWQKTAALLCCCAGVMVYSLGKKRPPSAPEVASVEMVVDGGEEAGALAAADEIIE